MEKTNISFNCSILCIKNYIVVSRGEHLDRTRPDRLLDRTGYEEYCGSWNGPDESCACLCPGLGPVPGFPVLGPVWTGTTLTA